MNFQAIFHQPKSNFCFGYDKDNIEIRIRTAKGDIDKVILTYGDKYDFDNSMDLEMELIYSDRMFDYFTATIQPPNNRLAYYFTVKSGDETGYYTEWGAYEDIDKDTIGEYFFHYPYINEADIHVVPEWVKDAVFYQIFPERFYNGDKSLDPVNVQPWGGKPECDNFFGGDIQGIIEKIDYLCELGVNAIYMTPIFEATTNHKYNTLDYFKIDPHFGTKETLKELVAKCHEKGIKVVLDAVFNHTGDDFPFFMDVIEKGAESKYKDWYVINELPICKDPLNYHTFAFVSQMPKLNTGNDEVVDYFCKVAKYWIEECDIDGWRLDVANEIDHRFWRKFREAVKSVKEDAYIVGEIWHDSKPWLMGDQYDATMNYPVTKACADFFAKGTVGVKGFKELISNTIINNTRQVNEVMMNLLDSHDTARFINQCNGDKKQLKLAEAFLLTYMGCTSIYYGTEIGMTGGHDPDCRKTMVWDREEWDMELFQFYKDIIRIRKENECLRRGDFRWIDGVSDVVAYERKLKDERIVVLINNSSESNEITVPASKSMKDLLTGDVYNLNGESVSINTNEHSVRILKEF